MGSPRLKALALSEAERVELGALAARRRTAQGLALRARIVLACAETGSPRLVGERLDVHPSASPCTGWKGCATSRARVHHARSAMPGSKR